MREDTDDGDRAETETVSPRRQILHDIANERVKQDAKWGEQNWPSVADLPPGMLSAHYGIPDETIAKMECDNRTNSGELTWADILIEELAESVEAFDEDARRGELIQAAAVIVAWIECIDRHKK